MSVTTAESPKPLREADYFPCYQPIISLNSGRIDGYECLARFHGPAGKLYSAGQLLNDSRYSVQERLDLDRRIRQQAFDFFAARPETGYLAINISPVWVDMIDNFTEKTLPTIEMARRAGIDLSRIVIEITENIGDLRKLMKAVKLYQAVGMMVAIDDFGAGASQVDRIEALKPNIVKLDMRLFKDAAQNKGISSDIALAVHSIASRIGCHIVCEGVETEKEFNFGVECGCTHVQGFLFDKADESPLDPGKHKEKISDLKVSYLEMKKAKLERALDINTRVKDAVLLIRSQFAQQEQACRLDPENLQAMGIIRYYLCDKSGNQISPNFELRDGAINIHQHRFGMNWGHRPYFALFQAHHDKTFHNTYTSGIYRDVRTRVLCQTYGNFLDDGKLLLVDVKVQDPTLYIDATFDPV